MVLINAIASDKPESDPSAHQLLLGQGVENQMEKHSLRSLASHLIVFAKPNPCPR